MPDPTPCDVAIGDRSSIGTSGAAARRSRRAWDETQRAPMVTAESAKATGHLLVDWEIRQYVQTYRMLEPFEECLTRAGVISYGLSSMGYDIRVTDEYKIFTNVRQAVVDPKQFSPESFVDFTGAVCVIPPNSFALGRSLEYFRLPRSVMGLCLGKSSYARCGIVVNITPLEPEWEGHLTIEISNTTPLPARIYSFEGVAQVLFFETGVLPEVSYADRKGKYQGQQGITLPKV